MERFSLYYIYLPSTLPFACVMLKLELGSECFRRLSRHNTDIDLWIMLQVADKAIPGIPVDTGPESYTVSLTLGWWSYSQCTCSSSLITALSYAKTSARQWRYILLWSSSSIWSSHSLIQPAVRLRMQGEKISEFACTHQSQACTASSKSISSASLQFIEHGSVSTRKKSNLKVKQSVIREYC